MASTLCQPASSNHGRTSMAIDTDSMKTIGLIGGIGWRSTADYYRILNEEVGHRLGGLHSARLVVTSFDFAEVRRLVDAGEDAKLLGMFTRAAVTLERAGADVLALCSNAAHGRIERLQSEVGVPILHIADATAASLRSAGVRRIGLLGTRETMERPFMREALAARAGVQVLVPPPEDREWIHEMIFGVLEQGLQTSADQKRMQTIIAQLAQEGAEAAVLGCTELPLLMLDAQCAIPTFDTTALHAKALVDFALTPLLERIEP